MVLEALVVIVLVAVGFTWQIFPAEWQGLSAGLAGSIVGSLLTSGWMLPRILRRADMAQLAKNQTLDDHALATQHC